MAGRNHFAPKARELQQIALLVVWHEVRSHPAQHAGDQACTEPFDRTPRDTGAPTAEWSRDCLILDVFEHHAGIEVAAA